MLPAIFTLGNLLSGFTAICCCMLSIQADGADLAKMTLGSPHLERFLPTYLSIGAIMVALGGVFDGLDGRVARLTRKTSDFGGQLDSLADAITFGAAPALLTVCLVISLHVSAGWPTELVTLGRRLTWLSGAVFLACAALRLARFNVENVHDESAHYWFKGLPSPGAAGLVAALVLFHEHVISTYPVLARAVEWTLPPATMFAGLMMVSRVRYAHVVNLYFRRKRPPWHLVLIMIIFLSVFLKPAWGLAIVALVYTISGPIGGGIRLLLGAEPKDHAAASHAAPLFDHADSSSQRTG